MRQSHCHRHIPALCVLNEVISMDIVTLNLLAATCDEDQVLFPHTCFPSANGSITHLVMMPQKQCP